MKAMLTNDSFYVELEQRDRLAIADPAISPAAKWRERAIAASSVAILALIVLGFLALRLWISLPSWVHFGD
jgi:hypothetical protein